MGYAGGEQSIDYNRNQNQNNNLQASFLDQSPLEDNRKFSKGHMINPDYSREQFLRKKTLSKTKIVNDDQPLLQHDLSPFGRMMRQFDTSDLQQRDSDSGMGVNSPFGLASPMNNQNFKIRQSNVMRDCNGQTHLFKNEMIQPTI